MRILIWGTGFYAEKYLKRKEIKEEELVGFVESSPERRIYRNILFSGREYKIYRPCDVKKLEYDYILICVFEEVFIKEIAEKCLKEDILDERIIFMKNIRGITLRADRFIYYNEYQNNVKIEKIFPIFRNEFIEDMDYDSWPWVLSYKNNEDILQKSLLQTSDFKSYTSDYFRYRTFEFVAEEINKIGVEGDVAEVGVAEGEFSRLINAAFRDRRLYMFDTFNSFDREEFIQDISTASQRETFYDYYKNINAENVLETMPYKEKCIIRKGLFPSSAVGLEDKKYAFVSIDVDLEKSIYKSLEYFYPRLSDRGVIFLHDYRCYDLEGVNQAVQRYEQTYGVFHKVPIADRGGTLIITKS